MIKKLTIKYERGHSYVENYEKTNLHCLSCGNKEVWQDTSPHDYGYKYLCTVCETAFTGEIIQLAEGEENDYQDAQRIKGLREV